MKFFTNPLILVLALSIMVFAQKPYQGNTDVKLGDPIRAHLNLNNISTIFKNTGLSDIDVAQQNSGFKFPKQTGKTAVYMSGLLWGVKISGDPQVRVGGSTYREGLQGGKIISPGTAEDPNEPHVRIYRVRPDVYPGGPMVDLSWEASDEGKTEQEIRAQYELDWTEWRATDGAPFDDVDSNGVYDPNFDVPGIKGAAQTIWFTANDLDASRTHFLYGTDPIGIEYQATLWEYNSGGALNNLFFRSYKLINKSNTTFDSMYVSMWSDTDIGDANNDFVGCDTIRNLGFGYNGISSDPVYDPLPPPSVGFRLIRGPLVPGMYGEDRNRNGIDDASDFGFASDNSTVSGSINLPMTAFYYFCAGLPNLGDPPMGLSTGANQFYNFMQGKYGTTGEYFINPVTNQPTTYALSGDPVTSSGWIDGMQIPPGDRRLGLAAGPFQMEPGAVQHIVIAEIAAGAVVGIDYLSAVSLMKYYSNIAQNYYDSSVVVSVPSKTNEIILKKYFLGQNYPNPFNPSTTIRYQVPEHSFVSVKVYDILGNEIATLVNEEKPAGSYEVEFNGSDLTSGIYFYQLQSSSFMQTKKTILLK